MKKISMLALLAGWAAPLFAQTTAAPQPPQGQMFQHMLVMLAIVFLIFYFMVFSPQQKKAKAQALLLDSLKKGDAVRTSSGIIGRVAALEKDYILLEIASNVRVKFERAHIVKLEEKEAA